MFAQTAKFNAAKCKFTQFF